MIAAAGRAPVDRPVPSARIATPEIAAVRSAVIGPGVEDRRSGRRSRGR